MKGADKWIGWLNVSRARQDKYSSLRKNVVGLHIV
jgi:hypothetical protein